MVVGDSMLIKNTTYRKTLQRALGLKKAMLRVKKTAVMRTQEGGIRVWCSATIDEKSKPTSAAALPETASLGETAPSTSPV